LKIRFSIRNRPGGRPTNEPNRGAASRGRDDGWGATQGEENVGVDGLIAGDFGANEANRPRVGDGRASGRNVDQVARRNPWKFV
jgi:hypothetical protein